MTPSRAKAIGSVCLFTATGLIGSYDRLRAFDDDMAHGAVMASVPLLICGIYFGLQGVRRRRPRR